MDTCFAFFLAFAKLAPIAQSKLSTSRGDRQVIYVNFAAALDDGEAITGAIAVHRHWAIGTDDRRALAFFAKAAPQLQRLSTLELMKHWVDASDLPADVVRTALRNVRLRARYEPHAKHPLYEWWRTYNVTGSAWDSTS